MESKFLDAKREVLSNLFVYTLLKTNEKSIKEACGKWLASNRWVAKELLPIDLNTFVGIEVEVEGINGRSEDPFRTAFWEIKEDGSLRNHGMEFVSHPIRGSAIPIALHKLNDYLTNNEEEHDFSKRTSVHVHVNVRDLTVESLFNFILTYIVFEAILYKVAYDLCQKKRDENIFCIPVYDSGKNLSLPLAVGSFEKAAPKLAVNYLCQGWKKYSGINLVPLQSFGTVEFRQLGGISNVRNIMQWINLILTIKRYGESSIYEILKDKVLVLNTNSMYEMFTKEVFGDLAPTILRYNVNKELERGVTFLKYIFESAKKADLNPDIENSSAISYLKATKGVSLDPRTPFKKKESLGKLSRSELEAEFFDVENEILRLKKEIKQVGFNGASIESLKELDGEIKEMENYKVKVYDFLSGKVER